MKKAFAAMFAFLSLLGCAQSPVREGGYAVDAAWPKPLPNNWTLGQVAGIAVDARDHVWVIHRPKTLIDEEKGAALLPPRARCCVAAPPVIEFDGEGNLLRAWGGPGQGYEWPENEHGIYIDRQGNVWVGGNDPKDHQLIKFTPDGKFLMQIGRAGQTGGSNSPTLLGRPAHMEIDAAANELYIADGYGNKRVIVLDASTGAYKRHWGAYGRAPNDEQQKYFYLADGTNDQVLSVERESGRVLSSFGRPGRYAGQFLVLHNIGIDSKGNLYTSEVGSGKRAQKFRPAN